jgi:hypothetical protein
MNETIKHLDDLVEILNLVATEVRQKKGSELGTVKIVLLDLMKRIQSNLYGMKLLMNEVSSDRYLILPVSLLTRTCLSDALTGFYLLTFSHDKESFENELKVMALDFIGYSEKLANLEPYFSGQDFSDEEFRTIINVKLENIASSYPKLVVRVENLKLIKRKPKEIRESSRKELFLDEGAISKPLTDNEKFEHLFSNSFVGVKNLSYMYPLFRFYSQFHHYTSETRELADLPIEKHLPFISLSLVLITQVLKSIAVSIELSDTITKALGEKIEEINIIEFV